MITFNLIYIFIILPLQIKPLAREKNRSAMDWSILSILACIGAEFGLALLFVIGSEYLPSFLGLTMQKEGFGRLIFRLLIFICGIIVGQLMKKHLLSMPVLENIVKK
jgi:hypothetical protein